MMLVLVAGCADDKTRTQSECDAMEDDIRAAAESRGLASDACVSKNPEVQADFGDACRELSDCRADCCK